MALDDQRVDLQMVSRAMDECLKEDEVILSSYLEAYHGLYKFFCRLGSVFGFVGSEILVKINILDKYLQSDTADCHYATVESMLHYEKQTDRMRSTKEASGSRTLLRLHRAMAFINRLLKSFHTLKDDENTGPAAKVAYKESLGKFHPWLVQKSTLGAMYFLPNLQELVKKTTVHSIEEFKSISLDIVNYGEKIYNLTQRIYQNYDCLDLP